VTLSFWVRSSLTGTFGGVVQNGSGTRNYPFTYTISAANTWEQKTVTIAGETSGSWSTDNGVGITVGFGLGVGSTYSGTAGSWSSTYYLGATGATSVVGTNGATFYITGVQLEKGSTATAFDFRSYGTELALCQRYYTRFVTGSGSTAGFVVGVMSSTTGASRCSATLPVTMRTTPTFQYSQLRIFDGNTASPVTAAGTNNSSPTNACIDFTASAMSSAVGRAAVIIENGATGFCEFAAEL
jgi:hypothetical protein